MEIEAKLDCLPIEILAIIFSYLESDKDFNSVFWTCKTFAEAMCQTTSQKYKGKSFNIQKNSNFLIKNKYYNIKDIPNNKFVFSMLSTILHNSVIRLNVENQQDMDKLLEHDLLQHARKLHGKADIHKLSFQLGEVKHIELNTPNLEIIESLEFTEVLKLETISAYTLAYIGYSPNLKTLLLGEEIIGSINLENFGNLEVLGIKGSTPGYYGSVKYSHILSNFIYPPNLKELHLGYVDWKLTFDTLPKSLEKLALYYSNGAFKFQRGEDLLPDLPELKELHFIGYLKDDDNRKLSKRLTANINTTKFGNFNKLVFYKTVGIADVVLYQNIKYLSIVNCDTFREIKNLSNLEKLIIRDCNELQKVTNLSNIKILDISNNIVLVSVTNLTDINILNMKRCGSFMNTSNWVNVNYFGCEICERNKFRCDDCVAWEID